MLYNPPAFRFEDPAALDALIGEIAFATLITVGADGPIASHAPMLLERDGQGQGRLVGHLAKANPHLRDSDLTKAALAIFAGPNAYVSPGWYPSKAQHGRVVPTWNYAVVHVRGRLRTVEAAADLRRIVDRLTERHEAGRAKPWATSDAPEAFVASQLAAIVGFEIEIASMEGKLKLSQNRDAADQAGVVAGLQSDASDASTATAEMMRARLPGLRRGD